MTSSHSEGTPCSYGEYLTGFTYEQLGEMAIELIRAALRDSFAYAAAYENFWVGVEVAVAVGIITACCMYLAKLSSVRPKFPSPKAAASSTSIHPNVREQENPLPTENLLEDTDGLLRPPLEGG